MGTSSVGLIAAIAGLLAVAYYFYPFVRPAWARPVGALWGYYLGRRLNRAVLAERASSESDGRQVSPADAILRSVDYECQRHDEIAKRRADAVGARLALIEGKLAAVSQRTASRAARANQRTPGQVLRALRGLFVERTARDSVLFVAAGFVLVIDTLIAVQVLTSLGLGGGDLRLFGRAVHQGYAFAIAAFLTTAVAGILHIVLGRRPFEMVGKSPRIGMAIGAAVVLTFAVLLLGMVLFPDRANSLYEAVLRLAWVLGVFLVCWLLGEIIGDDNNYTALFVCAAIYLVPVLYIVFGGWWLAEVVGPMAIDTIRTAVLGAGAARLRAVQHGIVESHTTHAVGLWRGATLPGVVPVAHSRSVTPMRRFPRTRTGEQERGRRARRYPPKADVRGHRGGGFTDGSVDDA
jgi:hypothetical protein